MSDLSPGSTSSKPEPTPAPKPELLFASEPKLLFASEPKLLFAPEPEPTIACAAMFLEPGSPEVEESAMVFSPERRCDAKERRERPPRRYDKKDELGRSEIECEIV